MKEDVYALLEGQKEIWLYLELARRIREEHFGRFVETCAIVNAKSGLCPSDCHFCAQAACYQTGAPVYPLLSEEELLASAERASLVGINRFSFVTSGIKLNPREFDRLLETIRRVREEFPDLKLCASLGQLGWEELKALREAGVSRYHHNLETAKSFYPQICSRQSWKDRLATAIRAQETGLSLCCGGIFGLGESPEQIIEFIETLRILRVDSVPVNFLHPIPGTPLAKAKYLSPLKCLAILSLMRIFLPETEIRVCGGREYNLRDLQALALLPANALMVGNYLTTRGRKLSDDWQMIFDLGYSSTLKPERSL